MSETSPRSGRNQRNGLSSSCKFGFSSHFDRFLNFLSLGRKIILLQGDTEKRTENAKPVMIATTVEADGATAAANIPEEIHEPVGRMILMVLKRRLVQLLDITNDTMVRCLSCTTVPILMHRL